MIKRRSHYLNKIYTVNYSDLAGIAATFGVVALFSLPKGSVVKRTLLKHSIPFAGPSISAMTARIVTANHNYGTAFNVFQAAGAETFDSDLVPFREKLATTVAVTVAFVATGANLSVATAGSLDVIVSYEIEDVT